MAVASEAKELLTLCRIGRLYDIEKWIAEGKPLEIPVSRNARKKTLLEVAVETGFHSLVELIAKHDSSQPSKNAALETAVSQSRLDLIELLVANGAEITSVPFADVLLNWERWLRNVEVGHCFHNLLLYRDRELRCILQQPAPIKPLQVQFISVDCATFLSPQIDPIQQGFLWLGYVVFAVSRSLFLEAPEEVLRYPAEAYRHRLRSELTRPSGSNAG
jgi:hypothetical protein